MNPIAIVRAGRNRLAHALRLAVLPCLLGGMQSAYAQTGDAAGPMPASPDTSSPASQAGPASSSSEAMLAPITVTAGQPASGLDPQLPVAVHVTGPDELKQINMINTEDALKYLPNFGIRKRYIGDQNSLISVRGTNNSQSARGLVYADGMLLSNFLGNTYSFAPKWSMVFPDDIERVETFYGPFSALYPGNSMGATVAITTRMPTKLEASVKSQFFSQHFDLYGMDKDLQGSQQTASIGDKVGNVSFLIGADHLENTSQPMQFATLKPSATPAGSGYTHVNGAQPYIDQYGQPGLIVGTSAEGSVKLVQDQFKLKLAYDITPTLQAGFSMSYWNRRYDSRNDTLLYDDAGRPVYAGRVDIGGQAYTIDPGAMADSNGRSESALYGLSLKTRHAQGWNYSLNVSSFALMSDTQRTASLAGPNDGPGTLASNRGSGWKTLEAQASYTPAGHTPGSHHLVLGYHFDRYRLDSDSFATDNWQTGAAGALAQAFQGTTSTQALYAQDAWLLAPRWTLTTGLRYEQWRAYQGSRADGGSTLDYAPRSRNALSPKASLAYELSRTLTLRASLGKAYRFPTVSELFQGSVVSGAIINNDPNLKPESTLSKELALDWDAGVGQVRMALFQDDVKDTLYSQTDTTVYPNVTNIQNIDKVRNRGVELDFQGYDVGVQGLDLTLGAGYTQSTILENSRSPETEGNLFPRVPRWRLNAAATWHFNQDAALTVAGRYSGRQYNTLTNTDVNPDTYGGSSTFLIVDARLNYRWNQHVEASLGVNNIFNKQAFIYHPYPGRTVLAELKIRL